eukprot:TRINITY_DN46152_c0_g1_i1.p3 TRINITY_DN46152_c0_g1~~TRINITY_DN46152_c0_g1_i1.p3  ORF type:complete len:105 (-),score=14.50 TRINITY_DN46152_c0_g1_i1:29-319(-)
MSDRALVVGYGHTVLESKKLESVLPRKASLQLIDELFCKLLANESDDMTVNDYLNYNNMLCGWNAQVDTCDGDSGGPLYIDSDADGIYRSIFVITY